MDTDEPPILLPCAVCGRTFSPDSLERHIEICSKNRSKKRRPFDSAKQRLQGTELAEFLPKQETRRHQDIKNFDRISWKKKHDDLLRTIREARGEIINSPKQSDSLILSGAPTRANEKGTCPTCNRHFGLKAYDRHVAWCKDRITRVSVNPATNLAKERLEARIRYRAPTLKNRRAATREKYSPGSMAKTSLSAPALVKPKENTSMTNCNRGSPIKQKPAVVRRPGQQKESSPGPMKSRIIDRTNRPTEDHDCPSLPTSCRLSYLAISSRRPLDFPVPPIKLKNNDSVSSNEITLPIASSGKQFNRDEIISHCVQNDETKNREACFVRMQKNLVSARSQSHPKLNNIAVNDETLGVTIQPCTIYKDTRNDQLMTWKQISHKRDSLQEDSPVISCNPSQECHQFDRVEDINVIDSVTKTEKNLSMTKNDFTQNVTKKNSLMTKKNFIRLNHDINKIDKDDDDIRWLDDIQNLNQTCLIKDSEDIEQIFHSMWKPIRHSPRVEFYFRDTRENEIHESDEKKLQEETMINNEEINIAKRKVKELKINNENKENDDIKIHVMEELMICKEVREDNKQASDEEIGMVELETEKLNIKSENEKEDRKASSEDVEIAEYNIREIEINNEDKRDSQIVHDEDTAKSEKLSTNKKDKISQIMMIDKGITGAADYIEVNEVKQNLSDSVQYVEVSNIISTQDISKNFEGTYSKELPTDSTANKDYLISDNFEMLAPQNSALVADNYFLNENINNVFLQVEVNGQYQEQFLNNSNKFEDIGDNIKDGKTNFNENSDNYSDNKTRFFNSSIAKAETNEGLFASSVNINSDYGNDDKVCVEEYNTQGTDDLQSSIMLNNESQRCREEASTSINLSERDHDKTVKKEQHQVNPEVKHKIRKSMKLRGSSDSLISSVESVGLANIKRPEVNSAYERETIEIIRPSRRNRVLRYFPDIRSELVETRENSERSYWQRATKISRDRVIGLDPYHERYKLTKRNPRVCILPPVPNPSLINHSPGGDRQRNGNLISDEELSSPDSYKPQDHGKLSNDSAYSSLNRKYSHHGRSTTDMTGRFDEDVTRNGTSLIQTTTKCKMSKFCHECGQRFPETAKFCCECGIKRLAL